jgi:hypothetical protein
MVVPPGSALNLTMWTSNADGRVPDADGKASALHMGRAKARLRDVNAPWGQAGALPSASETNEASETNDTANTAK